MNNVVIAFCGKARSGKNTAAKMVYDHVCDVWTVREFAFAQKLKDLATEIFGWDGDKTLYPLEVRGKGRNLLINMAMAFRGIDPDVWVNYMVKQLTHEITNNDSLYNPIKTLYIGTDTRFVNEIESLKKLPADKVIVIHLTRTSGVENIDDPSEKDLDNYHGYDYIIEAAGGDLDKLDREITAILKREELI